MSFTPENSAIKVNKSIEDRIAAANGPEQIKEILHEAAVDQKLVVPDIYDHNVLLPVNTPQPRGLAKTVTVNGVKHFIEGATETELAQNEVALYHQLFHPAVAGTEQPRDPATGQFRATADQERAAATAADPATDAARQAELRAKMIRGEISPEEFAIQSGAMDRALATAGIDPEALREVSHQKYEQNWASATEKFLRSSDWPGGEENMKLLGEKLIEMNATEKPSVEVLRRAYADLKSKNLLVENAETTRERRLAEAKTPAEIREILDYRGPSGIWGGR